MINNDKLKKIVAKEIEPDIRNKNFSEVSLGYTKTEMALEADRCLSCKNEPCREGCPVNVPIRDFILKLKEDDVDGAYKVIAKEHLFPSICGRVCPQERQCEARCIRGIKGEAVSVGLLERYVGDNAKLYIPEPKSENGIKIAVIGSGPAGIACAVDLRLEGFSVSIFEAFHELGGVLTYGIPEFRLPKALIKDNFEILNAIGVSVEKNVVVGKSVTIKQLTEEGFKAIFIATGAGLPRMLNIPGEQLNGVISANGFLTRTNLMKGYLFPKYETPVMVGKKVAVVGAGNVAMDAARTAKRLGAEDVYIIYRRGAEEIPARAEEVRHAKEEGIIFNLLTNPIKIEDDGNFFVKSIVCELQKLGEPDASGRRSPEGTGEFVTFEVDQVISAVGQTSNPTVFEGHEPIERNKKGTIVVGEDLETSMENVYAGGDIVTGAATVILAMGSGRKAAKMIKDKLLNEKCSG